MSEPTAFPRGKRKSTSTTEKPTSKKRATTSSTKEQSSIATSKDKSKDKSKDDFLFGNDTIDSTIQQRSYERKQHQIDGYNSDDSLYDNSNNNNLSSKSAIISSLPLGGGAVLPPTTTSTGKRIPPKIEALSFSKFNKGTKVLGCIKEVHDDYALVSLPTLLTGYIKRNQLANGDMGVELTKVLPGINTIMAFYVAGTTTDILSKRQQQQMANNKSSSGGTTTSMKKRRIELSVYPQDVNIGLRLDEYLTPSKNTVSSSSSNPMVIRGQILSIEDHGCLVDLGGNGVLNSVSGVKQAFLKFDNIEGEYEIVDDDASSDEESDDEEENKAGEYKGEKGEKKKGGRYKHQLNKHRIYDFTILPSNIIHSSSSSSNSQVLSSIIQLGLPTPSTLATIYTTSTMIPTLSTLLPGQLISNIHVESFAKNGLCVTFNDGLYRGCLDDDNLGGHRSGSGVESKKKEGKKGGEGNDGMWWKHVFKGKFAKVRLFCL